jgi:hypothetical protein
MIMTQQVQGPPPYVLADTTPACCVLCTTDLEDEFALLEQGSAWLQIDASP